MTKQRAGPIRVFVVSRHPLFGEALCALLDGLPGIWPMADGRWPMADG